MMSSTVEPCPGLYGKLPSNGDFVTRRLPSAFVEPWDQWLQEALAESRDQLGGRWLDAYLTSPVWRFVLSPGASDTLPWAGLLMPSVDRVGRYFPLTLACPLPVANNPICTMTESTPWYDAAQSLLLSCLADDFDLETFDRQVMALGIPHVRPRDRTSPAGFAGPRRLPLLEEPSKVCPILLEQTLTELYFAFSLWWSQGSDSVEPSFLVCQGLPPIKGFAAMLAGDWTRRGWDQTSMPLGEGDSGNKDAP